MGIASWMPPVGMQLLSVRTALELEKRERRVGEDDPDIYDWAKPPKIEEPAYTPPPPSPRSAPEPDDLPVKGRGGKKKKKKSKKAKAQTAQGTGSRPGPAPHHWTHPPVSKTGTAFPGPATGG